MKTGKPKHKYLVALPTWPQAKGFNHRTVLVAAHDIQDAISIVRHIRPHENIGAIKKVGY